MKIHSSAIAYCLTLRYPYLFVLILFSHAGQSQNKAVFQTVPSELDLGQIRPREIFQDSRGFIWTGTVDGLMKYDGYDNTIYRHQTKDSTSISESQIKWITEDEEGFFWIVNMNGNLNKFDPVSETFELIFTPQNTTESPQILNKVICQKRSLWLKMESGEVFLTSIQQPSLDRIVAENVNDFILNQDKLWVATQTGLQYWSNKDKKFVKPTYKETAEIESLNGAVGKLFIDRYSNIWTISANNFYKVNPLSYQVTTYPLVKKIPFLKESLFDYYYLVDEQDRLWFWRFGSSFDLTSYHLLTEEIVRYPPNEETGLKSNAIRGALLDSRNVFWVATNNGLSYANLERTPFQVYAHQSSDASTISSNKIRRIVEDAKGRIWVATNGGGVNCFTKDLEKISTYRFEVGKPSLCSDKISTLLADSQGLIWMGSTSEGLSKLDPETGQFTNYNHDHTQPNSLNNSTVRTIYEDAKGNIWVGTRFGINLYRPETEDFEAFVPKDRGRDISVMSMILDKNERYWLTTYGSGLYQFDFETKSFKVYRKDKDNPRSFSHNNALAILEDQKGRLWISSSAGINLYHPETDDFTHYTKEDGFSNEYVVGMVEADNGDLWLSTLNGLIQFNPDQLTVKNYKESDGLPSNRFANLAYGKSQQTGRLFFGGLKGLVVFHPDSLKTDSSFLPLVISNFKVYSTDIELGKTRNIKGGDYKDKVTLSYAENTFTIDFSYLGYDNLNNIQYAYRLKGIQENWVNTGNNRSLTLSNLNPGEYTLQLKSTNRSGIWSLITKTLKIHITPPWWGTNMAYLSYFLLTLGGIYFIYNLLLKRKLAQTRYQQLREIDAFKTQFYTNITHEFRTPLTIIYGMTEKLKAAPKKWSKIGVEMIQRNSQNLLKLVNQLLDLQKLEFGKLPVTIQQIEVIRSVRYLIESFQSYAETRGGCIHFMTNETEFWMDMDEEKLAAIISNLLSNAIKFSNKNEAIYLQLDILKERNLLKITIQDNGIGIPAAQLPYIFDRFYQVDGSTTRAIEGTGIGLALTKELVQLLEGTIEVKSTENKGTNFILHFPIANQSVKQKEPAIFSPVYWENSFLQQPMPTSSSDNLSDQSTLLIIENNLDVQYYLTACLGQHFQLIYAVDGAEGIEKAIQEVPDIIISDVMMPKKDGFEVCQTLKSKIQTSHIPIILLTAKSSVADKIKGLEYGADAYLSKPFHPDELMTRINKLIELRWNLQQKYQSGALILKAKPKTEDLFLQNLQQITLANLNTPNFGSSELAKEIALSRSQLHRKLKALANVSTSSYINTIRLQEAKKLLAESNLNISEIAYQVGYSSPQYFSTNFSNAFNCSPSEYREQQ